MSKQDLDKYFPRNGACPAHPTRYARHETINAIKVRHRRGESVASLAANYDLPRVAIRAAISSTPDDSRMTPKEMRDAFVGSVLEEIARD